MKSLIVSKDPIDLLTKIFKSSFSKINLKYVSEVKEAKSLLIDQGACFPVIINAETNLDAQELIDMITDEIGECPIVVLGNNSRLNHAELKDNLFVTRLPLPLEPALIMSYMEKLFADKFEEESQGEVVEKDKNDFISLRLKSFYLYRSLPYDVYVQITDSQFMKVLSKDVPYNEGTIERLKQKNVRNLHLEKNNHINFLEKSIETIQNSTINKNSNNIDHDIKKLIDAFNLFQEYIVNIGVSEILNTYFDAISLFHSNIVDRIESPLAIHHYFYKAEYDIPEQSVLKSLLNCYMARKIQWGSQSTKDKLIFSAILHDAFISDPQFLSTIDLSTDRKLTDLQVKKIHQHVLLAEKVADQFTQIPEVSYIVRQHHQIPDSRGFPYQMSPNKINQVSALFIIINHYISEMLNRGNNTQNINKILNEMKKTYSNITAFKPVFDSFVKAFKA